MPEAEFLTNAYVAVAVAPVVLLAAVLTFLLVAEVGSFVFDKIADAVDAAADAKEAAAAVASWPTREDGTNKTLGEMSPVQRKALIDAGMKRIGVLS